jgi:hypothetical protein
MASFSPGSFGYAVNIRTRQFLCGFREFSFEGTDLLFWHTGDVCQRWDVALEI